MTLTNEKYKIEIQIDPYFTLCSVDNKPCDYFFMTQEFTRNDSNFISAVRIEVETNEQSKAVMVVAPYLSIIDNCAIIKDDSLIVFLCDTLLDIDLLSFSLQLRKKILEFWTGMAIFQFDDGYIIYGELEIVKLNKSYITEWTFYGCDIFIAFRIIDNTIFLEDILGNKYCIDKYGKEL